jgi:Na+-translocating ferredoxin:NAD+ oxidoreductase RnfD subunit
VKYLKAFGQFWYDFIIGDDWKIAVAVVISLAILVTVLLTGSLGDTAITLIGGALILVAFTISLAIDVRQKK